MPYYNADSIANENYKQELNKQRNKISELNSKLANDRYLNKNIYKKDQRPYYSPTPEFNIITNFPKDKIITPIEIKDDLLETASTYENLKNLENNFSKINKKENLNNISLSGKYMRDPEPYYDAGKPGREMKKLNILQAIEKVKEGLIDNSIDYKTENFKVETKIQNYQNANKENTNEMIGDSYFYNVQSNALININFILFIKIIFLKIIYFK